MYAKAEESGSIKKPWTEQEVLLLLEVNGFVFSKHCVMCAMLGVRDAS